MGVDNLYPYVRSSIQESFVFKKINPECDDNFAYKEIVFDGTCWLWRFMKGNYLMDYNQLKQICQQMVNNFKEFGYKLVVFMDANIMFNKLGTWLNRRASRSNLIFEFNDFLRKHGGHYPNKNNQRYWFANNGSYFFIGQLFKSCGCDVYYAQIDCDREMIGYYKLNKHKVYAVCSVDTDFLIFDCDIYLEMTSIQFENNCLYIKGFKHERFLKRFQLKQHHLSQLAAIMGCDVMDRSTAYISMISKLYRGHISFTHGEVDVIAKYLRDLEKNERKYNQQKQIENNQNNNNINNISNNPENIKETEQKKQNKKKHDGKKKKKKKNKNKRNNKMDTTKIRYNKNIKRKFAISENFYTPIYPLGLLDHPYLIMLMFQDYSDCKEEEEEMKMNTDHKYQKGVILDACMDDTSLLFPMECSAVILAELRKYLYHYLMGDNNNNNNNNKDIAFKEIVCYPFKKYNFHPSLLENQWRNGIIVNLNDCNDDNPLLKLKSYQFIDKLNENYKDINCIPSDLIVEDIIFLLKWLKMNHDTKMEETKEETVNNMDIDDDDDRKLTNIQNTESSQIKWSTSKNAKKNRRKKLKEIKRLQAVAMLNNRSVFCSSSHSKMNEKMDKKNGRNKNVKDRMWNQFELILESFLFQWKYRNIFLCKPYRNDIVYERSRCNEYTKKYDKKMSPISMHFQSIIYGIYEIIFAFLRLYTNNKWYKQLYHKLKCNNNENEDQGIIPCLKIYDDKIEEIESKIGKWRDILLGSSNNVEIPYCWDVFNVKLYHWIFHNIDIAKQWITECTA